MRIALLLSLCALLASTASAQIEVFDQPMIANGGVAWASQLWIDPGGDNDLDSDAIAYENFTLDAPATVTRVRWWGQVSPTLGFEIQFFNQDPGTVAMQPDLFRPEGGPLIDEIHTATWIGGSGTWQHYEVTLDTPLSFDANTRYFVAVIGRTPIPFATWLWAEGGGVIDGTFYWMRADGGRYVMLPNNRAMSLVAEASCVPDLTGDGILDFFDVSAFLNFFAAGDARADFTGDGVFDFFDVQAFLAAFAAGCP
jgi:hypothetical protein